MSSTTVSTASNVQVTKEEQDKNGKALQLSTISKKEFKLGITHDADNEEYDGTYSDSGEDSESEQAQTNYGEDQDDDEQGVVGEDEQTDSKNDKKLGDKKKSNKKDNKKPPAKPIVKRKAYQLVINVADTQYPVVRFVGKKLFKWKLCYDPEVLDCDLFWTDNAVQPETLGKMQPHQKINHFPGMFVLARKNYLAKNLKKMKKQFPEEFKFFPQTWLLPAEYNELRNEFEKTSKGKCKTFIVKPEASCQGRGIFLTRNLDDLNSTDHYVVQRYLNKPFLIDGLKFDFRIYVLLAGCDPMRIYVFKEGLARLATEEYEPPHRDNLENLCMHLTNYAINKDNPNFEFNEDENNMDVGHKRSMTSVLELLAEQGHDVPKLWAEIKDILIKTIVSAQPTLSHHYKSCQPDNYLNNMCFEILGFDVILDSHLRPWLLEINHTPSFTTDTPLDSLIKKNCIRDALVLMNLNNKARNEIMSLRREQLQKRVLTGKKQKLTQEEKLQEIKKGQQKRDEFEAKNLGNYEKVYPLDSDVEDIYMPMQNHALQLYENWTGANIRRVSKKEQSGCSIGGASSFNSSVKPTPQGSQPQPRNSIGDKSKVVAAMTAKLPDRRTAAAKPSAPTLLRASQSKSVIPAPPAAVLSSSKLQSSDNMEGEDGQCSITRPTQQEQSQQQQQFNRSNGSLRSQGGAGGVIPGASHTGGFSESQWQKGENTPNRGSERVVSENMSQLLRNKPPSPLSLQNEIKRQQQQMQLLGVQRQQLQQQQLIIEDDKQNMIKRYAQYAVDLGSSQQSTKNKLENTSSEPSSTSAYSYIRQSSSSQNTSNSSSNPQSQIPSMSQITSQTSNLQMNSGRQQLTTQFQQQQPTSISLLQQQQAQYQSQLLQQQQQQLLLLQQAKMLPGLTRNTEEQLAQLAFSKRLQEQANKFQKPFQISSNNNGLYLQPKLFDLNMLTKNSNDDDAQQQQQILQSQQRKDQNGGRNKQVIYSNVGYLGSNSLNSMNAIGLSSAGGSGINNYYTRRK